MLLIATVWFFTPTTLELVHEVHAGCFCAEPSISSITQLPQSTHSLSVSPSRVLSSSGSTSGSGGIDGRGFGIRVSGGSYVSTLPCFFRYLYRWLQFTGSLISWRSSFSSYFGSTSSYPSLPGITSFLGPSVSPPMRHEVPGGAHHRGGGDSADLRPQVHGLVARERRIGPDGGVEVAGEVLLDLARGDDGFGGDIWKADKGAAQVRAHEVGVLVGSLAGGFGRDLTRGCLRRGSSGSCSLMDVSKT